MMKFTCVFLWACCFLFAFPFLGGIVVDIGVISLGRLKGEIVGDGVLMAWEVEGRVT
jgi:hypothetical protein